MCVTGLNKLGFFVFFFVFFKNVGPQYVSDATLSALCVLATVSCGCDGSAVSLDVSQTDADNTISCFDYMIVESGG